MTATVRIVGIRAEGRHGASPGERDRRQPFVVDLEVAVEPTGDSIDRTGDYRTATGAARRVVEEESHVLIETLAERIATAVADLPGVLSCRAVVHKPEASARLGVGDVTAEATAGPPAPQGRA
jgi:dihydroneopterin aldolase